MAENNQVFWVGLVPPSFKLTFSCISTFQLKMERVFVYLGVHLVTVTVDITTLVLTISLATQQKYAFAQAAVVSCFLQHNRWNGKKVSKQTSMISLEVEEGTKNN